ncbi:MAG: heavy metal translocating P-type ATPase, partial [Alcanivoracaceae bacterium]|nr:heavy metal translocating P-type ATPase [Alcanivoracaceae bacterium]
MNVSCALPACAHCGAVVDANSVVFADVAQRSQPFCCQGCASAARLIHDLGLNDYYRFRDDKDAAPAVTLSDAELRMFALDDVVAPHVHSQGDQHRLRLLIEGIHCAACVWLLEKVLLSLPGVSSVMVNLATYMLTIHWRGTETRPLDIAQRIVELGYRPRLPVSEQQQAAERTAQRWLLARLLIAGLGAMQAMMYAVALYAGAFDGIETIYRDFFRIAGLVVATPVVFFSGWPFFAAAWRMMRHGQMSMDVPVALALLMGWGGSLWATWTGGEHVYFESIAMFVFFLLSSRWLEQRQRQKVSHMFARLQADLPAAVTRIDGNTETLVASRLLRAGDHFRVAQGDVIPVDAELLDGTARVEQAALTGESVPVNKSAGDNVSAGTRLLEGVLVLKANSAVHDSRLARIGDLIERAQSQQPFQSVNPALLSTTFVVT